MSPPRVPSLSPTSGQFLAAVATLALASAAVHAAAGPNAATDNGRTIPAPLPDHPGNVFLEGETVSVPVSAPDAAPWRVVDYEKREAARGRVANGRASLGRLPVGWYEVRWGEEPAKRVSAAVLAPLRAPTPTTSPIGCDVAMAWFYPEPQMADAANLCALAGVNWVRDRLAWGHVEPEPGTFREKTRYDASARIQAQAGLRVLQVNHSTPGWAGPDGSRFPPDLRHAYRFHRAMAKRWRGQILAFEPWNEADIPRFGGHTGAEMASFQKAACLGLKAGNPDVIACLNVFAVAQPAILGDLHANEAWPYCDTFNLHHYVPIARYPDWYAAFRDVSAGRPLWTTEFDRPVPWSGDEKAKEPSEADLRLQAQRVTRTFAAVLHEGTEAAFYFLLPHYSEGKTQFGILRPDLTPRPAYVALAAVGRLLADARPLGRLQDAGEGARAYLFRARPDGQRRDVLVVWAERGEPIFRPPSQPVAAFDHLGRKRDAPRLQVDADDADGRIVAGGSRPGPVRLTGAPLIFLFEAGAAKGMALAPPPETPERLPGEASPVVLQATWPKEKVNLKRSAYRIGAGGAQTIPLFVYNFSETGVEGTLRAKGPDGWRVQVPKTVAVEASGRAALGLTVDPRGRTPQPTETLRVTGDFGPASRAVLSVTVLPE